MNECEIQYFVAGLAIGFLLGALTLIPGTNVHQYNEAIEACEKDLPRSQECAISAKPKGKD